MATVAVSNPTRSDDRLEDQMASDLPSSPAPSSSSNSYPSTASSEEALASGPPREEYGHAAARQIDHFNERMLFAVVVSMPDGRIIQSKMMKENFFSHDLIEGASFFKALHGNCQSFFLSAAVNTAKQRLFSRIRTSDRMSHACELLCEFDRVASVARVSGYALRSAYEPSSPLHQPLTFITKHTATGALTHIDLSSIPYLGHLPTDMIGRSLISFVYAPDVHVIRQAHLDLHASRGRIVRSVTSIRFVAYNGALVRADSEWSAYINPWSKKMELIVARHKLVDAPVGDANVLKDPSEVTGRQVLPPPLVKMMEDELRHIMNKPVGGQLGGAPAPAGGSPQLMPGGLIYPAKDLAAYIDSLVESLVVNGPAVIEPAKALRLPERTSSNPDTSTPASTAAPLDTIQHLQHPTVSTVQPLPLPLSYNQINCLENVHRLLKSQSKLEEGEQPETNNEISNLGPSIPLTRETLMEHTRRYEAEYRATWSRRLSGALKRPMTIEASTTSAAAPMTEPPAAKQARASAPATATWTAAQREEYYRSLPPAPAPPPGHNYQITSMPLPSPATVQRRSAFSTVPRIPSIDFTQQHQVSNFGPLSVATFEPAVSVIKTTEPQGTLLLEASRLN